MPCKQVQRWPLRVDRRATWPDFARWPKSPLPTSPKSLCRQPWFQRHRRYEPKLFGPFPIRCLRSVRGPVPQGQSAVFRSAICICLALSMPGDAGAKKSKPYGDPENRPWPGRAEPPHDRPIHPLRPIGPCATNRSANPTRTSATSGCSIPSALLIDRQGPSVERFGLDIVALIGKQTA